LSSIHKPVGFERMGAFCKGDGAREVARQESAIDLVPVEVAAAVRDGGPVSAYAIRVVSSRVIQS